jgi:ATP synthase F1 gamma subunit
MITKKAIEFEISTLANMKGMVEAYEEVAAARIRRNRDSVLRARKFAEELNSLFQEVKASAANLIDPKKRTYLSKNGKTLFVFLSTNTGLYGDIVRKTFNLFSKYVDQHADACLIIGKTGLKLAQEHRIVKPLTYLDFPENAVGSSFLDSVSSYLLQFERVIVFYAKFEGIMHQEESMVDISGNPPPKSQAVTPESRERIKVRFFFEPEVQKILAFFEKEIFASVLEQTVREFELAKLSSRVVGLNRAIDHIDEELKKTIFKRNALIHAESNRKQLQTFSSMSLWNK